MDLKLNGKKIVVTASSRGLGKAIAARLAEEGAHLALCSRDEAAVRRLADDLARTHGITALGMGVDVSSGADIARFAETVRETFGNVDGLVCNAGGPPSGAFLTLTDEQWERAFQTNLMSVVRLVRNFHPLMKERGGRIIAIASSSVKVPIPGLMLSNVFRAGVAGLMKTLAQELAADGILVNTLCPGRIMTDRLNELDQVRAEREGRSVEEIRHEAVLDIPLGRYGRPEEFADMAAFLLSERNSYMTGSAFMVDGGLVKAL